MSLEVVSTLFDDTEIDVVNEKCEQIYQDLYVSFIHFSKHRHDP